jgi:hypothetical protein
MDGENMNIFVKLWFIVDEELIEVANILKSSLGLQEYIHDGEDTWEWCLWDKDEIIFDISRKHNLSTGIYDYPVGVYVKSNNREITEKEIERIGRNISKALKESKSVYGGS